MQAPVPLRWRFSEKYDEEVSLHGAVTQADSFPDDNFEAFAEKLFLKDDA